MLRRCVPILTFLTTLACLRAAPIRIVLAGDSTVAEEGGWGPGFRASFSPPVETLNLAANGRSSKSFRAEKRWEAVLAAKPDYVLIQFGHNDVPGKGPDRETDAATTFRENMARYVEEARAAGAQAVLVTSIVRRNFDREGKLKVDSLAPYVQAVRALAAERNIPLIDLYELTRKQAEELGEKGCEATIGAVDSEGKPDHTHLAPRGQAIIGAIAAHEFVARFPQLKPYLHELTNWRDAQQQSKQWYGSAEAIRIADNLLIYQNDNGGWEKNIDMALPLAGTHLEEAQRRKRSGLTTIDNGATYTQMRYLAQVYAATGEERYAAAFRRGLGYLLAAQYSNGGWPQFYPLRHGYWDHITYNDDAMIGVLELLRDIANGEPDYAFLTPAERERSLAAVQKGIACILKTQIRVRGRLTVWCAQHDEVTLQPAQARSYELPSLSGSESVGIVEFLMKIPDPSPAIVQSIEAAVEWFRESKIEGIRVIPKPAPGTPKGFDMTVVADPAAPPLWARFYDIATNRPIFCGRDGIAKSTLAEIEYERRNGYRWYVDRPARLLNREYPEWKRKWLPDRR
jgi:PelA/Pel-15E family pectate lyase